jgi:hypothetical protein
LAKIALRCRVTFWAWSEQLGDLLLHQPSSVIFEPALDASPTVFVWQRIILDCGELSGMGIPGFSHLAIALLTSSERAGVFFSLKREVAGRLVLDPVH